MEAIQNKPAEDAGCHKPACNQIQTKLKSDRMEAYLAYANFENAVEQFNNYDPLVMPIVITTNFIGESDKTKPQYSYSRDANPNRNYLEKELRTLEDAKYALCFPSGMAATISIFQTLIRPGDHVICTNRIFLGTSNSLIGESERIDFEITFVDMLCPKNVKDAIRPNTKYVFLEVLSNPSTRIINVKEIAQIVSSFENILLIVDNTLLSSFLMKPLDFGAHIVIHSITKLINGHGDVTMGVVLTNLKHICEPLRYHQGCNGIAPSPFDCYLVTRSLKTLRLRVQQHCSSAQIVAEFLVAHPAVESVMYPGLSNHPEHELAKSQMSGFGGVVSFYLKDGYTKDAHTFVKCLKTFKSSWGLGLPDSIVFYSWKWFQEYPIIPLPDGKNPPEEWTENFIRLWIGLEESQDLVRDLKQAFEQIMFPKSYVLAPINNNF